MQIILKGCTQDILVEISEKLGSQVISDCDFIGVYDDTYEDIFRIELDGSKCILRVFPDVIYITRIDGVIAREMSIVDSRFEEVIIK